jgi:lysophospholipase L1-like esterase
MVLGDSLPAGDHFLCDNCIPFATWYAHDVEKATGSPVTVLNEAVNDTNTADLLHLLRTNRSVREEVAASDIVVVMSGHNDTPWVSNSDPCDGAASAEHANWDRYQPTCVARTAQGTGQTLSAVLNEIGRLRQDRPTAYRVVNFYNDNEKDPLADPGGDEPSRAVVDAYSRTICRVAKSHDMLCADVYHAFNGPHGTNFDGPYVASDHVHPSTAGHRLIAAVLARLGYADVPAA